MPDTKATRRRALGKPVSVHPVSPAYVQRAAIMAVLALIFFLGMFAVFMIRREALYLILAAAFFVIEVFTLIGFFNYRRNIFETFEHGICYKKACYRWDEIDSVESRNNGLTINISNSNKIELPTTLHGIDFARKFLASRITR